jgi:hypothetical protein
MNNIDPVRSHGITDLLGYTRQRGLRLSVRNGQLRYRAPKGALIHADIESLKRSKLQALVLNKDVDHAPLALSQIAHWNLSRLGEQPSYRSIGSITKLRGPLLLERFDASLTDVVSRHEALRTRIVLVDGQPIQQVEHRAQCDWVFHDLSDLCATSQQSALDALIEAFLLEPIRVSSDSLLAVRLVKIGHDEHFLVAALEHSIADMFSMNILLRDLFTIYTRKIRGVSVPLEPVALQFADFALWQTNELLDWVREHGEYWRRRLDGYQRLKFPFMKSLPSEDQHGWGSVPMDLDKDLVKELHEWCRLRRTTLVMAVFTAYAALLSQWCRASDVVLRFQTDGRDRPEIRNTIGYFAASLYLRMQLSGSESFLDLLALVTEEHCSAREHVDHSYLETQLPIPDFVRSAGFNWMPMTPGVEIELPDAAKQSLDLAPVLFRPPVMKVYDWDADPALTLYEGVNEILGSINFPRNRFSLRAMEIFGRNYLAFVRAMLKSPEEEIRRIPITRGFEAAASE